MPVVMKEIDVVRYFQYGEFNPGSPKQLLEYIKKKGYRPDQNHKTGGDTTGEATLKRLSKEDVIFKDILEWRGVSKIDNTYVSPYLTRADEDARIHGQFNHNPSTMRLASTKPNLQNVPDDEDEDSLESRFRHCIVASPGCLLVEADFSAIEAVLTGYFMGDKDYMRIATMGMHSFVLAALLGKPADRHWPDEKLSRYLADIKAAYKASKEYKACKKGVHLCLTGEHEVLTPTGWVRLDQLPDDPTVMQWDRWQITPVTAKKVELDYSGTMIEFDGIGYQLCATPDHRLPNMDSAHDPVRTTTASTIADSARIPISGILDGTEHWTKELALACAVQADAQLVGNRARFHLHKVRKISRLKGILRTLGREYSARDCGCGGLSIQVVYPDRKYLDSSKNFNLEKLMALTVSAKLAFLEEVLEWDGCRYSGATVAKRHTYFSTNHHNVYAVQTIAHLAGKQSLVTQHPGTDMLIASLNRRRLARVSNLSRKATSHTGKVYCVTVPSSWFLVRHRGRISVTGNSNYGGTTYMMLKSEPTVFPTIRDAERVQNQYFTLCPKLKPWQTQIRNRAAKEHFLGGNDHPFKYRHWFWDVYQVDGRPGADHNKVVAYYPQSTAGGVLYEACLRLVDRESPYYIADMFYGASPLRALIHDSILGEVPVDKLKTYVERLVGSMSLPIPQLGGLQIGVDVKIGTSWGEMKPAKNYKELL